MWDIEATPDLYWSFGARVRSGYLNKEKLYREGFIVCAAWRWLGEDEVHSVSTLDGDDPRNDLGVITKLHEVVSEADYTIAHNGDRYDMAKLRAKVIEYGLDPMGAGPTIDTLKWARQAKFPYNDLDSLAKRFGHPSGKVDTDFDLWKRAAEGDAQAIRDMTFYCENDIDLGEFVYYRLRPYAKSHPHVALPGGDEPFGRCSACGSDNMARLEKAAYTTVNVYPKFRCLDCRRVVRGTKRSGAVLR